MTFVQRFGGSLNLNVHLHVVSPDGVFVRHEQGGVRFVPVAEPTLEQVEGVVDRTRKKILRWLARRGYLDERDIADEEERVATGLDACQRIALHYGTLTGLSQSAKVDPDHARFEPKRKHRCHARTEDGFDLDARVVIARGDDRGRERLVRYCARPALALPHLSKLPDGRYAYRTKYGRNDRTHRVMTGTEWMARLAALVPPPRYPLTRYHGVFAGAHTLRRHVVPKLVAPKLVAPKPPASLPSASWRIDSEPLTDEEVLEPKASDDPAPFELRPSLDAQAVSGPELRSPFLLTDPHLRRLLDGMLLMTGPHADWATLLRRSHDIDVLDCPRCHGRLRLRAVVRDREQVRRFLRHVQQPLEPRHLAPARDPTVDNVA